MPRYLLTGGQYAFLNGSLVYPGQEFTLPEGKKPPRAARLLAEDEKMEPVQEETPPNLALSEMQIGDKTVVRQSDIEPV